MTGDNGPQNPNTVTKPCRWGTMTFNRHDSAIGRALSLYGEFAEAENRLMAHFVGPGDTAVDVGANVGTVTLFLAQAVGGGGRVHAFEPQPEIFHCLKNNVEMNGHRHVACLNAAAGARDGTIEAPIVDYGAEGNFGALSFVGQGPGKIEVTTVDGLGLDRCRLIKIDVEGMEPDVLEGARATIRRFKPVVYTENKKGERSAVVIEYFLERDYALYWHFAPFFREDNFRKEETNVFGETGDTNMLCLPPGEDTAPNLPRVAGPGADWHADYTAWMEKT